MNAVTFSILDQEKLNYPFLFEILNKKALMYLVSRV